MYKNQVFSKQVEEKMDAIAARKPAKAPRVKVIRTEGANDADVKAESSAESTAAD